MSITSNLTIWSDCCWIDDNTAWFVLADRNVLFARNIATGTVRQISSIPESGYRRNPSCMKYREEIFCFPDKNSKLWVYSLVTKEWREIKIDIAKEQRLASQFLCADNGDIWFASRTLCKIYIFNVESSVLREYSLKEQLKEEEKDSFLYLSNGVLAGRKIYFAGMKSNIIMSFDMDFKEVTTHHLKVYNDIMRIQRVDHCFYIVGTQKKIYIWNESEDDTKILDAFPKDFGIYSLQEDGVRRSDYLCEKSDQSLFYEPIDGGRYMWLIPWVGTEILLLDKENMTIEVLDIENEKAELLEKYMQNCKYVVNYVRENRYIGLFSMKNWCQLEIDMNNRKICYPQIELDVDNWNDYFEENGIPGNSIKLFLNGIFHGSRIKASFSDISIGNQVYWEIEKYKK